MKKEFLAILIISCVLVITIGTNVKGVDSIDVAAEKAANEFFGQGQPGVVCVSYSDNDTQLQVSVESSEFNSAVPPIYDGYPTVVTVDGIINAYDNDSNTSYSNDSIALVGYDSNISSPFYNRYDHWTTLVGGISFGGDNLGAGTLGNIDSSGNHYMLSCAHVIAIDDNYNFLPIGSPIFQPSQLDGLPVQVGTLSHYITIHFFIGWNYADAAIATCTQACSPHNILNSDNIHYYTVDFVEANPHLHDYVRQSGRTSGVTFNTIRSTHSFAIVHYGNKWALFRDLYTVNKPFANPGDSGAVVDNNGHFVGLVMAGNSQYNLVCRAHYIQSQWHLQ